MTFYQIGNGSLAEKQEIIVDFLYIKGTIMCSIIFSEY